jgi:SusD family.
MKTQNILLSFFVLIIAAGCNKVLDKKDLGKIPPDLIFNDSDIARLNLDFLYNANMPSWGGGTGIGSLTGIHGELSEESYGESKYFEGTITTRDVQEFGTKLDQNNNYGKIRNINMFIKAIRESEFQQGTKDRFIGQALFFRAFRYFDLVRIYGGVPLVLEPLNAIGDEAKDEARLPRNSTADCFKQIVADLDSAIKYLPGRWSSAEWGHITSGAAAAFKGRVLLTYASPQFNPNDLPERWQAAYDANLQAKTILDASNFGLHDSYGDLWFKEVDNPEAVLVTGYNDLTGDQERKNNGYDNGTRPSYLGTGGGSNQPSWEMVKAYPMKDGKMPGASDYSYSDQFFYKDRDPRFNQTIAYNGTTWFINGNQNYRLWTYLEGNKSTEPKATVTGFYTRKAIMTGVPRNNDPKNAGTDWIEIRYAEVLLNLAEAAIGINKLGTGDEGYQGLIAVRKRAGIEAGADNMYGLASGLSRDQLFKAVLHERQIEFAFEGKRFWDLRRWKLFEETLNGTRRNKIIIRMKAGAGIPSYDDFKNPNNPNFRDVVDLDYAYTNYFEVIVENDPTADNNNTRLDTKYAINWQPTYYYFPIPQQAIDNNPNLEQNNNWGGSFDPLQ